MNRLLITLMSASALLAAGCVSNPLKSNSASTASTQPAAESKPADGKATQAEPAKSSDPNHRYVKSRDGSFDGEVWGQPAKNSKFAKLQIGMSQAEVEDKIGRPSDTKYYVTGKAWIPFYFGNDAHRYETYYKGSGSLIYTGGGIGGGHGQLIGINHDASEDGYQ